MWDHLHSERFADKAPAAIVAILLDEGEYLCSVSTMYRLLRSRNEVQERRRQRAPSTASRPELLASAPREVWSWDITTLKGPRKWSYFYLYVILDVFSRTVVGWCLAEKETAELAEALIQETLLREEIVPGPLTLHANRGSAMTSHTVAELRVDLGVETSPSRPHTSNDNPFSESHFKTLKFRPEVPERFGSVEDARHVPCSVCLGQPRTPSFGDRDAGPGDGAQRDRSRGSGRSRCGPHAVLCGASAALRQPGARARSAA